MQKTDKGHDHRPVVFGEVLFDEFEDGSSVLGGAPFNVAWHLQGFGLQPLFITRIGKDPRGDQILRTMQRWHMDVSGVQRDGRYPTGRVAISLEQGQPSFNILPRQAYDYIAYDALPTMLLDHRCALLYHGSLIVRAEVSGNTLETLQAQTRLPTFVDINLRDPWWDKALVGTMLNGARWAKLNEAELAVAAHRECIPRAQRLSAARALRDQYQLELLVLTLGADGAYFITAPDSAPDSTQGSVQDYTHDSTHDSTGNTLFGEPVEVEQIVDTVGAGDAFSAVTILGLNRAWPVATTLQRATEFAAAVCGLRGATTEDLSLYATFAEKWCREMVPGEAGRAT